MIRHLAWFLLALSALFNVFFAAGYVRARAEARDATANGSSTAVAVAGALALDAEQKAVFTELREQFDADAAGLRANVALVYEQFTAEIEKPEPDLGRLRELVTRGAELDRERQVVAADRIGEFVECLRPEQRRRLAHHLNRSAEHARRQHALMERFDVDGNGELDESERAEAQRFIEERRAARARREAEMLERFDANGDGELDDEERTALRRWMMEQRRGSGRDGGGSWRGHGGDRGDRGGPGRPGRPGRGEEPDRSEGSGGG